MIRLIASDIDGTLLPCGAAALDDSIFQEIFRLREKGILFCPASGRTHDSLLGLFSPVAKDLYYICENGAAIYGPGVPGPVLDRTVIERSLALELSGEILADPRCDVLISGATASYVCPKWPGFAERIRALGNRVIVVPSPTDVPEEIIKVSAYCPGGVADVEPELAPRWSGRLNVAIAGDVWLDFTLADKGTALRRLCAILGVEPDEVMAFGDNYNDVSMLSAAGRPYIMSAAAAPLRRRVPGRCRSVVDVLRTL